MTEANTAIQEPSGRDPSRFSAVLTPHRSLGPKGFMVLMAAVCLVSFGTGLFFYLLGAWPVIGFMGLDVALIYAAFKLNFRALRLYETVDLTQDALTVTRVAPSGQVAILELQSLLGQAERQAADRPLERAVDRLARPAARVRELPHRRRAGGFRLGAVLGAVGRAESWLTGRGGIARPG